MNMMFCTIFMSVMSICLLSFVIILKLLVYSWSRHKRASQLCTYTTISYIIHKGHLCVMDILFTSLFCLFWLLQWQKLPSNLSSKAALPLCLGLCQTVQDSYWGTWLTVNSHSSQTWQNNHCLCLPLRKLEYFTNYRGLYSDCMYTHGTLIWHFCADIPLHQVDSPMVPQLVGVTICA